MGKSEFNLCSNLETIGFGACGDLGEPVFSGCNAVTEMTLSLIHIFRRFHPKAIL